MKVPNAEHPSLEPGEEIQAQASARQVDTNHARIARGTLVATDSGVRFLRGPHDGDLIHWSDISQVLTHMTGRNRVLVVIQTDDDLTWRFEVSTYDHAMMTLSLGKHLRRTRSDGLWKHE
jgi:hypothetical protein